MVHPEASLFSEQFLATAPVNHPSWKSQQHGANSNQVLHAGIPLATETLCGTDH